MISKPVRVLFVDDNQLMAGSLERRLAFEKQVMYVGWVADPTDAARVAQEADADIVMLDVDMPGDSFELARFLEHVDVVVAVHGYGPPGRSNDVLVGGSNRRLAAHLASGLRTLGDEFTIVDDIDAIPAELRGLHPDNPVNRPRAGGVQLELPARARGASPSPRDRGKVCIPPPPVIEALAASALSWREDWSRPGAELGLLG